MSEAIKTADQTRKAQDQATRATQSGVETAPRVIKEAADRTDNVTEGVAGAAADVSSKAAASGRDAILFGMRTAAGVGGKVVDISFDRGHHLLNSTVRALDIYADATERSAERVQALMSSAMFWTRGIQKMQRTWLEMIDHSMERAAHRPQDLLRCTTLVEVAEVQRHLYTAVIDNAFESSSRMLELARGAAQDAARPLQSQHR